MAEYKPGPSIIDIEGDVYAVVRTKLKNLRERGEELQNQVSDSIFLITLGQSLSQFSCFRIMNNKAYKVTSIDADIPYIDGITLQNGAINSQVQYGKATNTYEFTSTFSTSSVLFLSQSGFLTDVPPSLSNGDVFSVIVGRTIDDTNKFIFDPQTPIRL